MKTWARFALLGYVGVIIALTCLKTFYQIGYLWLPENQRVRELRLIPFVRFFNGRGWFAPLFDMVGNIMLFAPLGALLVVVGVRVGRAVWAGFALSLSVEVIQFVFAVGRTDISDLIFNTLGAFLGACVASVVRTPSWRMRWHAFIVGLTTAAVAVFIVLVILGPALGDPAKVVPVGV